MKRLRIGFLCNEYPPDAHGGIGTMTEALATALARHGDDVHVVGFSPRGAGNECLGGVTVHRLARPAMGGAPAHLRAVVERWRLATALATVANDCRLDVIEVPDWHGDAAMLGRTRAAVVCRLHGSTTALAQRRGGAVSRMTRWCEHRTLARADAHIAPSGFIASLTRRCFPNARRPNAMIPNFIPLPLENPAPRERGLMIYVGRCTRKKGLPMFLQAARRVLDALPGARVEIAGEDMGEGTAGRTLVGTILATWPPGLAARVEYRGVLGPAALDQLYRRAMVLMMPSPAEAFGLVAIEAMARGCVAVVAGASGPAEVVARGGGVVVQPPTVDGFAAATMDLLATDPRWQALSHGAITASAVYTDEDQIVLRNRHVYTRVARRGAAR